MKKITKKYFNPSDLNGIYDKETFWPDFTVSYQIVQDYRHEVSNIPERLRHFREEGLSGGILEKEIKFSYIVKQIIDFINERNLKRSYRLTFSKQENGSFKIEQRDKTIYNKLQARLFIAAKKEFLDFDFTLNEISPGRFIESGTDAIYIYSKLAKNKNWQLEIAVPNYRFLRRNILRQSEDIMIRRINFDIDLRNLIRCALIKTLMEYFRGIFIETDYNTALLYLSQNGIIRIQ